MKLSQWAKEQGLTYKGAWRMWRAGQLPVPAEPLPTGTIIVKEIKTPAHAVALYARVSSSDQRKDWEAQLGRLGRNRPRIRLAQWSSDDFESVQGYAQNWCSPLIAPR